jgi:CRISPR-associated protein Cas5h
LKILSPISKIRFGINLVNTKDNKSFRLIKTKTHEPRTQIRTEFVKNPKYRIYMVHNNPEIFEKLKDFIENHKSYYTVSLGLSELIANFNYVGTFDYVEITQENEALYIDSIIPAEKVKEKGIVFEPNKKYFKEKIPGKMTTERIVEKYVDVIYEPDGKPIKAKVEKAFRLLNGETVIFL